MKNVVASFLAGLLFAGGLALSGMTLPSKIIGFLDVTGAWDPSLAFVMVGALSVYTVAYRLTRQWDHPRWAATFAALPSSTTDRRLWAGSALFGAGWGLGGYCPGPALVASAAGVGHALVFSVAMVAAFGVTRAVDGRWATRSKR